jgi:FdrA protein
MGNVGLMQEKMINKFLQSKICVINIGLESFYRDLKNRDVPVVHLDWSPPAGGDPKLIALLSKLRS